MSRITETVKHLLIINCIFFLATSLYGNKLYDLFALHYFDNSLFQIWQPITHMFLHGNFSHILFNMIGLWMFGSPIEQIWGRNKFIFFYISSGLGAAVLQMIYSYYDFNSIFEILINNGFNSEEILNTIKTRRYNTNWLSYISEDQLNHLNESFNLSMVGASGALYGILVAFAFLFPNISLFLLFIPIPIKAKYFVPILIAGDLFFGVSNSFSIGPIAHFAHVGGALTGLAMILYWKKNQFNKNRWDL
ncbi:MAG: rhomboid family intramembrane serine protease [Flavobacteriaceae bacterium]|nr:rhomboid family intramembrane serine protease [Flavobacteriaceae bacterium]|tara:strand:+ start:2312 stop:3055 length:744 start_codon:yes stop_codon:yes gene_type:complete